MTVKRSVELTAASRALAATGTGNAVLWMVYPKGASRNYRCEFNRDRRCASGAISRSGKRRIAARRSAK